MPERTCPICQAQHQRRGIYCGSRCKKRAENAKRGGWEPTSRPMPAPYDCVQCGTICTPSENVVAHATRFCGQACKHEWHHINVDGRPSREATTAQREAKRTDERVAALLAEPTRTQHVKYKRAVRADPCAYCGTTPSGLDHIVPTGNGGADDWTNWSGCCKQCNSIKGALPLLVALPWVPVAREYHEYRRRLYAA